MKKYFVEGALIFLSVLASFFIESYRIKQLNIETKNALLMELSQVINEDLKQINKVMNIQNKSIELSHADDYEDKLLKEGSVIASFERRKLSIKNSINLATQSLNKNVLAISDDKLLEEVTALVEMPNILTGSFEEKFLNVPQECLILTMKTNQRYFPLFDSNNKLTNHFIIVSNLSPFRRKHWLTNSISIKNKNNLVKKIK